MKNTLKLFIDKQINSVKNTEKTKIYFLNKLYCKYLEMKLIYFQLHLQI